MIIFAATPYLLNPCYDFLETWIKCSVYLDDVQNSHFSDAESQSSSGEASVQMVIFVCSLYIFLTIVSFFFFFSLKFGSNVELIKMLCRACSSMIFFLISQKHAYIILTPLNPTFIYSKTGVYMGVHYFFYYFCSKHRLWVLVRTASPRRF